MFNLSPAGQQLAFGTAQPLQTREGRMVPPDFTPAATRTAASIREIIPQTTRWPLPGSGELHPLDYIVIMGVKLPLARMPEGGEGLDVSERKEPGSDYSSFVSHGKKNKPAKITLLLFRDTSLGYENGVPRGKDWVAEYAKIENKLIAKSLAKRNAVPVYYPTWHARGCDSLIFVDKSDPVMVRSGQFTVELEGRDPRTIRLGDGSKKVAKNPKDFGTRADPAPQQNSSKAPSTSRKGK